MPALREKRRCRKCRIRIMWMGGAWVSIDPDSSGDGLSYCPPDPDAPRHGVHQPAVER